jgi:VWFA-related protein
MGLRATATIEKAPEESMRIGLATFILSCITTLVASQEPQQGQGQPGGQVFKSGSKTVAVYVTVSDGEGRLVPNLTQDDFEIYDNGKKQTITVFQNGVQPITLVMMLDRSGSMIGNFGLVRSAAEQFVGQLLPGDRARIGSFANRIQVDPRDFTASQHDLLEILRTQLQEAGPTPLWNAVNVGITSLLHQEGRRVVLVFTDGVDHPIGSNNISYHDVQKNAEQEDVMIFAVGLASRQFYGGGRGRGGGGGIGGLGGGIFKPPPEEAKVDAGLPKIAAATGGGYFELTSANNLASTFRRIADELHRQYALGFSPQNLDGKTHKLEVRLKKPELLARARKTYIAKKDM